MIELIFKQSVNNLYIFKGHGAKNTYHSFQIKVGDFVD